MELPPFGNLFLAEAIDYCVKVYDTQPTGIKHDLDQLIQWLEELMRARTTLTLVRSAIRDNPDA